jgi:hypothetical protein
LSGNDYVPNEVLVVQEFEGNDHLGGGDALVRAGSPLEEGLLGIGLPLRVHGPRLPVLQPPAYPEDQGPVSVRKTVLSLYFDHDHKFHRCPNFKIMLIITNIFRIRIRLCHYFQIQIRIRTWIRHAFKRQFGALLDLSLSSKKPLSASGDKKSTIILILQFTNA